MIILNYAPNISSGSERMLALLFDMNSLWEEYVLVQLKKACQHTSYTVTGQETKGFWANMTLRPDIVISQNGQTEIIIDTKWKRIEGNKPSINDLRQMYVYNDHWESKMAVLLYPGATNDAKPFYQKFHFPDHSCGILKVGVVDGEGKLDEGMGEKLKGELGIRSGEFESE